MPLGTT